MKRTFFVALLGLAVLAPAVEAQDPELERALRRVAELWSRGDAAGLIRFSGPVGLSVEIGGDALGPRDRRQAEAALRHVFQLNETVEIRASMAAAVPGDSSRAYGELAWLSRSSGASIADRTTIFVGLMRPDGAWRLTQIRIMK